MGLKHPKSAVQRNPETEALINDLANGSHFTREEIEHLLSFFSEITQGGQSIAKQHFQRAMNLSDGVLFHRLFELFDRHGNGSVTFPDVVFGLSVLSSRASLDEKIHFSFQAYDIDRDGKISKQDLAYLVKSSWNESSVKYTDQLVEEVVNFTFVQYDLNKDNFIDKQEYKGMIYQNPKLLDSWIVDFKYILHPLAT